MKRYTAIISLIIILSMLLSSCAVMSYIPADHIKTDEITTDTSSDLKTVPDESSDDKPDDNPKQSDGVNKGNDLCTYAYTDSDKTQLESELSALEIIAKTGGNAEDFKRDYDAFEDGAYTLLITNYRVAGAESYIYYTDSEIQTRYLELSEFYNDVSRRIFLLYKAVYESDMSDVFFADWTEEEIRYALKYAEGFTEEFSALQLEYDNIKTRFNEIQSDADFNKKSASLYMEAISVNNRMAKIMGYDNFMDYAFDMYYSREYTPEDASTVTENVKRYIVPLLSQVITAMYQSMAELTGSDYAEVEKYVDGKIESLFGEDELSASVVAYLDAMSGEMLSEYRRFFEEGNYIIANDGNVSRGCAFSEYLELQKQPFCYFGPGYHSISNFMHEFGHYFAFTEAEETDFSLDLAEVHSQGNEWLYTAYLSGLLTDKQYTYVALVNLADNLLSLVNCLTVYEFEMYVYTHSDYTADSLDSVMNDVLKDFGVYDLFTDLMGDPAYYWHHVVIENPGYYISYSMSLIPSLELYAFALDDFTSAAQKYMSLTDVSDSDTFSGKLEEAGIYTPFDRDAYILITEIPSLLASSLKRNAA